LKDTDSSSSASIFKPNAFIIANHADELTPWVPVVATLTDASGYLSIPCCAWGFDRKFEKGMGKMFDSSSSSHFRDDSDEKEDNGNREKGEGESEGTSSEEDFIASLNLGGDNSSASSSYSVYRIWLAKLSRLCGWRVECETLRIPSTRNWGVVGGFPFRFFPFCFSVPPSPFCLRFIRISFTPSYSGFHFLYVSLVCCLDP
jgi:tRNASer (uridine44-2'-O)-methyltransferase